MERTNAWALLAVGGLVAIGLSGCQKPGLKVHPVEGVVLLDGTPVSDATVEFAPVSAEAFTAYGRSDAEGRFRVTSTRGGPPNGGAVAGDYTVLFKKADYDLKGTGKTRADDLDGVPLIYEIPKRYGDLETSGLKATVKPGRNDGPDFRFELTSTKR
jgi:hypothetical protein